MRPKFKALSIGWYSVKASIPHNENYVVFFMVLLQKLGHRLAPSDEGAVERSETEGENSQRIYLSLLFLSLRNGKAVPPPSSEGGDKC